MEKNILDLDGIISKKIEAQMKILDNTILAAKKELKINLKRIQINLNLD